MSRQSAPHHGNTPSHGRGFSLMETLVVLAILSLAMAVIAPFLPGTLDHTQVKAAARELAGSLRAARGQAIHQRQERVLLLDVKQRFYKVGERQRALSLPEDTTLELLTAAADMLSEQQGQIRFFPDGSSTGGQIKLQHKDETYLVDVHWLTGGIRISP